MRTTLDQAPPACSGLHINDQLPAYLNSQWWILATKWQCCKIDQVAACHQHKLNIPGYPASGSIDLWDPWHPHFVHLKTDVLLRFGWRSKTPWVQLAHDCSTTFIYSIRISSRWAQISPVHSRNTVSFTLTFPYCYCYNQMKNEICFCYNQIRCLSWYPLICVGIHLKVLCRKYVEICHIVTIKPAWNQNIETYCCYI